MNILRTSTLAVALLAAAGVASPAFAQKAGEARAKASAKVSKTVAADAARNARLDAKIAKEAAHEATVTGDVDASTARQAAVAAEDAKNDAVDRTAETMGAVAGARDGIDKDTAAAEAAVAARQASRAAARVSSHSAQARDAAKPEVVTVPVSPNASENARIATSAPGAMADYRHMTGAGRYHIDTNVLDVNHDGVLTREEASANITLDNQFASIDANADGRIDTSELRGWIASGGLAKNSLPLGDALSGVGSASAFQMLDLNSDGMLTTKEAAVQARLGTHFRSLDRNHDGYLSQAEFDAWATARKH